MNLELDPRKTLAFGAAALVCTFLAGVAVGFLGHRAPAEPGAPPPDPVQVLAASAAAGQDDSAPDDSAPSEAAGLEPTGADEASGEDAPTGAAAASPLPTAEELATRADEWLPARIGAVPREQWPEVVEDPALEQALEQAQRAPAPVARGRDGPPRAQTSRGRAQKGPSLYLYTDDDGNAYAVEGLSAVPREFRARATRVE